MNFVRKTVLVAAALLTLAGSPAFASTPEEMFVDGTRQWIAAYNAGDTEAIVSL